MRHTRQNQKQLKLLGPIDESTRADNVASALRESRQGRLDAEVAWWRAFNIPARPRWLCDVSDCAVCEEIARAQGGPK